jgi:O-antigen/teichoic acid export membrane protein
MWYKLDDKTRYGAYIALIGAGITLVLNICLIPLIGYMGSAITVFICFFVMMVFSYFLGQKYYPIPYELKSIFLFTSLAMVLYFISTQLHSLPQILKFLLNTFLMISFIVAVYIKEKDRLRRVLNFRKK